MIYHRPQDLPKNPYAITIGTFDGYHLGHQKVVMALTTEARKISVRSLLITFDNNPKAFIRAEEIPQILSEHDKLELLENSGADDVMTIPFDDRIRRMTKGEFLTYLGIDPALIIVGYDFHFGSDRKGEIDCAPILTVEPVYLQDEIISSSAIRKYLATGQMETVNAMLGRNFFYSGIVEYGKRRGRLLGFPTMNVTVRKNLFTLRRGVYVTLTTIYGKTYNSVTNIGYNPTFPDKPFTLETHVLHYDSQDYGEPVRVHFLHYLRDEIAFNRIEDLSEQIRQDVSDTEKYFKTE